ncbi:hypothetical protein ACIA8E_39540 [Streptomyces sp. NPDC051664]|uniref:hypothetical protein n=1 Tax=Streptomyces sp. NPDC051664 TaxID=3365668 RepID=UPI0037BC923F
MPVQADGKTSAELTDAYARRIDADLARVDTEIGELTTRLNKLDADRALLVRLRHSLPQLGGAATKATSGATDDADYASVAMPLQREDAATPAPDADKRTKRLRRGKGPTLIELVRQHLLERSGPVSVSEVSDMLKRVEADRRVSNVVVRNTLESMVAKSMAERSRQGNSVFYTLVRSEDLAAALQE